MFFTPPILAFGFANLAALGWLAAAAAPILIHLWMRQTRRETPWAAIRFLRSALERQAHKLRLQHWILLAVRTLILLLVALAAAKPFFDSGPLSQSSAPTHWVVVLDASLSMTYTESGASRLEVAKRHAASIVRSGGLSDRYTLCVMAAEAATPIGRAVADRGAVLRAIERVEPTHTAADLAKAAALVTRVLDTTAAPGDALRSEVVVLSDLGENTWATLAGGDAAFAELEELGRLSVIDVGQSDAQNVCVSGLSLPDAMPTTGAPVELRGEVALFGLGAEREQHVELVVDGLQAGSQRVRLTPGAPAAIDFLHTFREPGEHTVSLRVSGDALAADDAAWLALDLSPRVRVLCVEGARGAARYVADALDPYGDNESQIEPVIVSDADLPTIELSDFACVLFCNVMGFGPSEAERVRRYVESGGGVVFFLGDRAEPASYNELFTTGAADELGAREPGGLRVRRVTLNDSTHGRARLAPIRVGPAESRSSYGIDPLDYTHPIVAPFRGQERAGLLTTPVARSYALALLGEEPVGAEVVLALEGGAPLVIAARHGLGRLVVIGTDGSLDSIDAATGEPWTALPAWPSFLPLLRGVVEHVAASGAPQSLLAGEAFQGRVQQTVAASEVRIERPDDANEMVTVRDGAWSYPRTDRIGVYRALLENGAPVGAATANARTEESNLKRVSLSTLPEWVRVREGAGADPGDQRAGGKASLHRWLIQLALLLVLVETALACWFGRGSA